MKSNKVNDIEIPNCLKTVPECLAYLKGFEAGRAEVASDAEPEPVVEGGQGHTADEIESDGRVVGWLILACCVFIGACILVTLLTRQP